MERSGAFDEAIVFLDYFEGLPDPRQRARVIGPLDEVLLPCLLAALAGAERIVDIARFGEQKRDLPRRFRRFADGAPSHDQLGAILAALDAERCQQRLAARVAGLAGTPGEAIAIKPAPARAGGNQTSLHEDAELFVAEQKAEGFRDPRISRHTSVDGGHDRIETRTTTAIEEVAWRQERRLAGAEKRRHDRKHP